jgi:D-alanyl-D-alanine carboxypeptidase
MCFLVDGVCYPGSYADYSVSRMKGEHMRARKLVSVDLLSYVLMCLVLVMGISVSPVSAHSYQVTPVPATFNQHLQEQLQAQMKSMHVPGAVVFVQSAHTGSWTASLGTSNVETHEPMHANNHFRIGSITKTLTGTVILQLVDEGKLKLNDPVSKYQREVSNGTHITIRELLNMRSGLYNYSEDTDFGKALVAQPTKVWTPKELIAIAFKHQPYFAPNQDYHYSNTNFILLGMIIEQITKHPVEQEFQQRIFKPLGMNNTSLPALSSAALPSPYSQGYALNNTVLPNGQKVEPNSPGDKLINVTTWNPSWGWTAGSAISTLHDLQIWSTALATGKLLKPATQKERLTWYSSVAPNLGYGLAIADFSGFIGHNGQIPGYQSFMGYMPEKDATIIVLTNLFAAPDGSEPADSLAKVIRQNLSS